LLPGPGETRYQKTPVKERPRLALYARRSLLKVDSVSLSRQEAGMRSLVTSLRGRSSAGDFFTDDDRSAKGGTLRPGVEALLDEVEAERFDGIVVWEFSRLTRNLREWRIIGALLRDRGVELYSVQERWLSLYGPTGFLVDWAAELAAREVERLGERITDWHAHMADAGAYTATAPFGMRKEQVVSPWPDRVAPISRLIPDDEPRPELRGGTRAEVVRDVANRIRCGASIRTVCGELNAAGVSTAKGNRWQPEGLRDLLANPLLAGYATKAGEILEREGRPQAPHIAVIPPADWHALHADINARRTGPRRARNEALLRGLVHCGVCGSPMRRAAIAATEHGRSGGGYACPSAGRMRDCPGNYMNARHLEEFVTLAVVELLNDPGRLVAALTDAAASSQPDISALESEIAQLRASLDNITVKRELHEDFTDDDGPGRYDRLHKYFTENLDLKLTQLRRQRSHRPPLLAAAMTQDVDATRFLAELQPREQTTVYVELIDRVVVQPPSQPRAHRFEHERVYIAWRAA
jgi:site-specific DNA recombinase